VDGLALVDARLDDGSARMFGDSDELAPGVVAVDLPGHTPGQVGLLVTTADGEVLLTSDAVHLYDELEHGRPFGVFTDLEAMFASYAAIAARVDAGALMVPGHDPDVVRRFPAVAGSEGLAFTVTVDAGPARL